MAQENSVLIRLEEKANKLRHRIVDTVIWAGSGHLGGALSMIDAVTLLYYDQMNINKDDPYDADRDRFIMSKGHAGIGLITILEDLGFVSEADLRTFNHTGSNCGIHLDGNKVPGVDASTGSLGHGLSIALGYALGATQLKKDYLVYCLLGDGECNEGAIWEAAMAIGHYKPKNLITLIDRNFAQIDGMTEDVMELEPFKDKWEAFGFHTEVIDGHDSAAMKDALERARQGMDKPVCLILETVKGNGVSFAAGDYGWHYGGITDDMAETAHRDLDHYHETRMAQLKEA
ncbi:MAG TPA: transketolase [Fastidiosipila sp.]|nr:transketolase [Fastidiosipila sp.]